MGQVGHNDGEEVAMSETIGEIKGRYPALVELTSADGDLAYRARIELLTLWGVFDKPAESAELTRLREELADAQNEGARQVILAIADALEVE